MYPLSQLKESLPRAKGAQHLGLRVAYKPKGHTLISLGLSLENSHTAQPLFFHPTTSMSTMTLPVFLVTFLPPWPDVREKWGLNLGKGFAYLNVFAEDLPRAVVLKIFVYAGFF